VVSIQALYLLEQQSLYIVRTIFHPSDTSSFIFLSLETTWTFVSFKLLHQVRDCQIYQVFADCCFTDWCYSKLFVFVYCGPGLLFYLPRAPFVYFVFLVYFLLFVLCCDCLQRLVSEMTYCIERDAKLYSLTRSLPNYLCYLLDT